MLASSPTSPSMPANSSEFSISNGFTEEKQEFEKLNSFFEIVTSNDTKNLNNEDEVIIIQIMEAKLPSVKKGDPNGDQMIIM